MVTINIGRNAMIFFSVVILVFAVAGLTIAYNSGGPASIMGHSLDELETCADGEILTMSGGAWICSSGGGGSAFGRPVWDSGWVSFTVGTIDTYTFPAIAGATVEDLFVDIQVKKNSNWGTIPAGISNIVTAYDGQGFGLAYTALTTSGINIYQGSNPGSTITDYRVRIWDADEATSYTKTCTTDGCETSCDAGDVRTGCSIDHNGGAHNNNLDTAIPTGANGCTCEIYNSVGTCYAICLSQ
jgi:hypothetical protein